MWSANSDYNEPYKDVIRPQRFNWTATVKISALKRVLITYFQISLVDDNWMLISGSLKRTITKSKTYNLLRFLSVKSHNLNTLYKKGSLSLWSRLKHLNKDVSKMNGLDLDLNAS